MSMKFKIGNTRVHLQGDLHNPPRRSGHPIRFRTTIPITGGGGFVYPRVPTSVHLGTGLLQSLVGSL